jgi:hypothetical protein
LSGALIGGFLFGFFVAGDVGFWGSFVIAFIGVSLSAQNQPLRGA